MPHRVLVVDDDESIRTLLQDYLQKSGFEILVASDYGAALGAVGEAPVQAAVIDYLLPKRDGFQVARALRALPGGAGLPVIFISGVFRSSRSLMDGQDDLEALACLPKPLDLDQLKSILSDALGDPDPSEAPMSTAGRTGPVPAGLEYGVTVDPATAPDVDDLIDDDVYYGPVFPPVPEEGDLARFPLAMLLSALRLQEATGMLDLNYEATHRRVYVIQGRPTFMQSNYEGENVGALLLRRGRIIEPDFKRCLRHMKEHSRTLQQSLLELQLVSEAELATAYKLLAGQLLPTALGMARGRYRWREGDAFVGRVPEGRFDGLSTLFEGIKRYVHPPQVLDFFEARQDLVLLRTVHFAECLPQFRRAFSADNVAEAIDGSATYRTITAARPTEASRVIPQLYALIASGMVVAPSRGDADGVVAAVNRAAAAVEDVANVWDLDDGESNERVRARERIARWHDRIMGQDFFEVFNVSRDADNETIKGAYFDLTRQWRVEAFIELEIDSASLDSLREALGRVREAYETLTDRVTREQYVLYLDRRARGLSTDAKAMHKSEQLHQQALAMVRRSDWSKARPVLEEALRVSREAPYLATLGWVVFNQDPQRNVAEAVDLLRQALRAEERLPSACLYMGNISRARGRVSDAKKWYERCLVADPDNVEATNGVRWADSQAGLLKRLRPRK